jgi:hypothetical protein
MLQSVVQRNREISIRRELIRSDSVRALQHTGFAQIAFDPSFLVTRIPHITEGIRRMTSCDDQYRFPKRIIFSDEANFDHDSGLIRRDEREQKWFFHLYPQTTQDFRAAKAPVERYEDFFANLSSINDKAFEIATTFAELWDAVHGTTAPLLQRLDARCFVTRVLRYLPRERGMPDATVHIDRSCLTIHWWANRAGLYIFGPDKEKRTVLETQHDHVCLFPGMKFAAATKGVFGSGTPHGVVDNDRDRDGVDDRIAVVSFVHCRLTQKEASWLKLHKKAFDAVEQSCVI